MALGSTYCAGLDIGQTSTKLVVLQTTGKKVSLVNTAIFHNRAEGLVDETEVVEHLQAWLKDQQAAKIDTRVGLPQYMAMTQVSDFPATVGGKLDEMVEYETQQLAGLTDEVFLHDYVRLKPFDHFQNPVLLAVCRDSIVDTKISTLEPADLQLDGIHMEGQALADTYTRHIPEEEKEATVLLLDVGSENTTMALVRDGQAIHLGSFLFGGDFFNESIARHLSVNESEAERIKKDSTLDLENDACALRAQAQTFIMELEAALECCTLYAAKRTPLTKIYLSGGGSLVKNFDIFLQRTYNCKVEHLRIDPLSKKLDGGEDAPEVFNIAYGLALQGVLSPKAHQSISLTPAGVRWDALRRKRAALPIISVAVLALLCVGYLGLNAWTLTVEHSRLSAQKKKLEECKQIAEPLVSNKKQLLHYQEMLVPFAARGNRNTHLVKTILEVNEHLQDSDWLFLVSDEYSYLDEEEPFVKLNFKEETNQGKRRGFGERGRRDTVSPDPRINILSKSVTPLKGVIIGGFTPQQKSDRLRNVTRLREDLSNSELFANVDEVDITHTYNLAIMPWKELGMLPFKLGLQFSKLEYSSAEIGGGK